MESVLEAVRANGIAFALGTENVFAELYESHHPEPDLTKVRVISDISYGPHERNRLDIYIPVAAARRPRPVLIYVHGGGFFSGDKAWTKQFYGNIGHYFAGHKIIVVAVNHRLVPDAVYPQGSEDIQSAREWVFANISQELYGQGDPNKVILFGHSSGGAHVASNLFSAGDPSLPRGDPLHPPVAGAAYLSVPWWFDVNKPVRAKIIESYYGSKDESVWEVSPTWGTRTCTNALRTQPRSPLGLFKRIPDDSPMLDSDRVPTYLGTVKWETKEATDGAIMLFNSYRERSSPVGSLPLFHVLDKHNHLSNILSIGTQDNEQGEALLRFIRSCDK